MDFNIKWKNYVKIDRKTVSDAIFALLDEANKELEDEIDNLMNDIDTGFVLE